MQRAHDDVHANLARLNAMLGIVSQQSQAPNAPITVPPELMDDPAAHLRSEARTFIITQQSLLNVVAQAQTRHSGLQQQLLKTEALLPINAEREPYSLRCSKALRFQDRNGCQHKNACSVCASTNKFRSASSVAANRRYRQHSKPRPGS